MTDKIDKEELKEVIKEAELCCFSHTLKRLIDIGYKVLNGELVEAMSADEIKTIISKSYLYYLAMEADSNYNREPDLDYLVSNLIGKIGKVDIPTLTEEKIDDIICCRDG